MGTGLLVIDIQKEYFEGGACPLVEPEAAAGRAAEVLQRCREATVPVVHVQHVWDAPDAEAFRPGTPEAEIHPLVAPRQGEQVVTKEYPNAFRDTDLLGSLRRLDVDHLVVLGMMTSMCVDATVRAAGDLGFTVTVIGDACAAPDLEHDGRTVPGADVHAAFLAALADGCATVVSSADFTPASSART
jgi:nicotinamidase-related amidase